MNIFIGFLIFLLAIRTFFWHLQNWQIREYRFDRFLAHSKTKEGIINFFNFWFFKGILPRPKLTGRIILIILLFLIFSLIEINFISLFLYEKYASINSGICIDSGICDYPSINFFLSQYYWIITFLAWERTIFLLTIVTVFISKIPVHISREILFYKAKKIIQNSTNLTTIGIAGSYGKSSTKEILAHLLIKEFDKKKVLFNPENQNNEVAIARLILKNKRFFKNTDSKFFIVEVGAYHRGEIAKVCRFIQPKISILTGLNAQHIDLFGSQKNIQLGKFEMAEYTSEKVFFNADNRLLFEVFEDQKIIAKKIALSPNTLKKIKTDVNQTTFELYGKIFTLPWPGKFFIENTLLSLECSRELGIKRSKLVKYLASLPPLERALKITKKNDISILWDTYSANPNGVMKAIEHLSQFKGQKIFIGIPLKELGKTAKENHEKIFKALKKIQAEIYWCKKDFVEIGKRINTKKFNLIDPTKKENINQLKKRIKKLKKDDVVLLESKLPDSILRIFK